MMHVKKTLSRAEYAEWWRWHLHCKFTSCSTPFPTKYVVAGRKVKSVQCSVFPRSLQWLPSPSCHFRSDTDNYNCTNELHFTSQPTVLVNWSCVSDSDSTNIPLSECRCRVTKEYIYIYIFIYIYIYIYSGETSPLCW